MKKKPLIYKGVFVRQNNNPKQEVSMINSKRIDHLRQIKTTIRGSDDYLIVGIDIGKQKHFAFFGTANGRSFLRSFVFENNYEGLNNLLAKTQSILKKYHLEEIIFGLESTESGPTLFPASLFSFSHLSPLFVLFL